MTERNRPLLLGHRGARAVRSIPENTLESFDRALADGCDGFEFDVRLTADGVAVICHDPCFHGLEIARAMAPQLPQLPHLEDVLFRYQQRAFLDIELKVGSLERITLELLRRYPPQRGFAVSSFLPEVLQVLREYNQDLPLGLICETRSQLRRWNEIPVEYVMPHYKLATKSVVHELMSAGKKVMVWTVNDPKALVRFKDLGVDGIISDETGILCRALV
jgi:glycerophosphoryl diester phosphodiesterase